MRSLTIVSFAVAALLVGAGCGDSKSDRAMTDVCAARDDITKQVDALQDTTISTATTTDVTNGLQAIRGNLTKIGNATKDLAGERRQDVEAANDTFRDSVRKTLSSLGTTVSLEDAASQLKTAFQDLRASYETTLGELECS